MKKTITIQQVTKDAKNIQRDNHLCDSCLGRLFAKKLSLSSNRLLGKKIHWGYFLDFNAENVLYI